MSAPQGVFGRIDVRKTVDQGQPVEAFAKPPREIVVPALGPQVAHFYLTRGMGTASEPAAGPVVLRLVQAA